VIVIMEVVDWPEAVEAGAVDVIVMSGVWKVKVAVACGAREPLVAVMVAVKAPSCVE
jgi:hypothetical protein